MLVDAGLDGIEVHHHKLNSAARRHFENLARRFGLLVTGGSDEHGWPQGFPRLGSQPVGPGAARAVQLRAKRYRG
jgi:predicted metal-dependent phosphoesterase TrpH